MPRRSINNFNDIFPGQEALDRAFARITELEDRFAAIDSIQATTSALAREADMVARTAYQAVLAGGISGGGVIVPPTPTPTPTPTPNPLPSYASAAFFGDSIGLGTASSDTAHSWAALVAAAIGATRFNQSISGTTLQNTNGGPNNPAGANQPYANNGRDRFPAALLGANKKAAVFIAYGFNDARMGAVPSTFNASTYAGDLREVVNGLVMSGYAPADIYIGSPYYITNQGLLSSASDIDFRTQNRAGFEAYVGAAASVAAEFGTKYCDLYAYLRDNGFASTIDTDNIHPLDAGHAIISSAWQSATVLANTRSAPTGVTNSLNGLNQIDASVAAVSGAAGYEFALVSSYANTSVKSGAGTTNSFTGLVAGSYRVKARASFSDGTFSPWAFAATDLTVAAAGGIFVADNFNESSATALTAHSPQIGGAWSQQTGQTTSSAPEITSAGQLYCKGTAGVFQNAGVPGSADVYVQADFVFKSAVTGASVGLAARMQTDANTLYAARYLEGTGWQFLKTVAGTAVVVGTASTTPAFTSGTKSVRLEVSGNTDPVLTLKVDGSTVITYTDNAGTRIINAGRAGMRSANAVTSTTGIHMDNFEAGTL